MAAKGNCEFKGNGGQYFVTVFIHMFLLSIVTLYIYSPWAWVKLLKLRASHTRMNGKQVSFVGTGGQLFVICLTNLVLIILTLGIYSPWAACKYFSWRAGNTVVEGRPSQFGGTGGSLFLFYLIHLVILPLLTFGVYGFYGMYRLYAWKEEHTRYGGEKTSFGASFGGFLKVSLLGWILNSITFGLFSPWAMCMLYQWQTENLTVGDGDMVDHFPPVKTNFIIVLVLFLVGLIPFLIVGFFVYQSQKQMSAIFKGDVTSSQITIQKRDKKATKTRPLRTRPLSTQKVAERPSRTPEKILPKPLTGEQEIKKLDDLIQKGDRKRDALYNRAWIYASQGNIEQAVNDYSKAIEIDQTFSDAIYNRALLYITMKQYDLALKDLSRVLKAEPRAVDALCNRGNVHYEKGEKDLAIQDYNKGLTISPADGDLYFNRAVVYLSQGKEKEASADMERAADLGHEEARKYLKMPAPSMTMSSGSGSATKAGWTMDLADARISDSIAAGL
ncbi:MAG: DUF898 family protein, partial [Thermodesulfobacteriota bacterium]|nr:DUF898 family protein [Thermodesulfobacteriota bacterium]